MGLFSLQFWRAIDYPSLGSPTWPIIDKPLCALMSRWGNRLKPGGF